MGFQEFGNSRIIPVFVNVPNESVHWIATGGGNSGGRWVPGCLPARPGRVLRINSEIDVGVRKKAPLIPFMGSRVLVIFGIGDHLDGPQKTDSSGSGHRQLAVVAWILHNFVGHVIGRPWGLALLGS